MARIVRKKLFVRKRPCQFCSSKSPVTYVDYKNEELLSKLVNLQGRIISSRITGTCAKHQRAVALAIKRARLVAILPYIGPVKREFVKKDAVKESKQVVENTATTQETK
ncbi:30S ribosomal protein S18 [Mycoplasmopsis arginini]|uniref:Small ribosomal subunit protein bS18 n=1 Tax=Mycoplasmopsis arginini TaxID=2094 RepID=A0A0C6G4I1_MYCAR|nr:30S ribosomal protein S18 [Mycoplasmopsis arginini]CRH45617.1 30S ribosomal protein S18 [Chlamydia trachomatis]SGA02412.1 30S ribosomal protein S18 [Chlamydia abortus]ENY69507.1 30S ribosomal protein S18 [Mycoplasmopsis arginini 7264]MCY2902808.1 30S ribosomal protein S18 [Mycoplasmopsis arginini QMP CG1-2758]MDI3349545.1 30S ribosomal protein S18 [Mycoplasmopsis arginini]